MKQVKFVRKAASDVKHPAWEDICNWLAPAPKRQRKATKDKVWADILCPLLFGELDADAFALDVDDVGHYRLYFCGPIVLEARKRLIKNEVATAMLTLSDSVYIPFLEVTSTKTKRNMQNRVEIYSGGFGGFYHAIVLDFEGFLTALYEVSEAINEDILKQRHTLRADKERAQLVSDLRDVLMYHPVPQANFNLTFPTK